MHKGSLYGCHYAHSKKSLDFYCYNLAKYFSHHGILINTVSPGFLDNDMFKNVKFFNKKNFLKKKINNFIKIRIKNNSVVNLINFLLNLEHKYINGKVYEIDGGY